VGTLQVKGIDIRCASLRLQFPALQQQRAGRTPIFLDGPGGTQVPRASSTPWCITSLLVMQIMGSVCHQPGVGPHLARSPPGGGGSYQCPVVGRNRVWGEHDDADFAVKPGVWPNVETGRRVMVTRLDHDANIRPWLLAARDAGPKCAGSMSIPKTAPLIWKVCVGNLARAQNSWLWVSPPRGRHHYDVATSRVWRKKPAPRCSSMPCILLHMGHRCPGLGLRFSGVLGVQVFRTARRRPVGPPRVARIIAGV